MNESSMMTVWQREPAAECRQRVMVIAQDQELKDTMDYALESYDFTPIFCNTPDEALISPGIRDFDYILVDFDVSGLQSHESGVALIRKLRQRFPLAIIIGLSKMERGMELLEAGANDFLRKPFAPYFLIMLLCGGEIII